MSTSLELKKMIETHCFKTTENVSIHKNASEASGYTIWKKIEKLVNKRHLTILANFTQIRQFFNDKLDQLTISIFFAINSQLDFNTDIS